MKLCESCWRNLRAAIIARGIGHLVKTPEGAAAEIRADLAGDDPSKGTRDPLLHANFAIWNNAVRVAGVEVMKQNPDGSERCPICYLIQTCACGKGDDCPFHKWIDHAADDAVVAVAKSA